ncbi:hypothetical protein LUCX_47 [Xanthomonas phage vB_XciM_LucasX]|nr:hypothetical protein LUCX_47 [Xanthomonas phage vB_XciM_LucasX]
MKTIVLPYDSDEWFTLEDHSLMEGLGLNPAKVIDQILFCWTVYVHGAPDEIYERTVNDLHEIYEQAFAEGEPAAVTYQQYLADENTGDAISALLSLTAQRLHHLLNDLPQDVFQFGINDDLYQYLRVEALSEQGRFLKLVIDDVSP